MHCSACFLEAPRSHRYCSNCGASLDVDFRQAPARQDLMMECAELKHATVLFADIVRSTEAIAGLDAEQAMQRLRPALALMCTAINEFGGTVLRTLGDGVMAVFGAPRVLKDDAVRACRAALRMQDLLATRCRGLTLRTGLHSGVIAFEPRQQDGIPGGGAHGLTVHIASRVMGLAAPGGVMASATTAALARWRMPVRSTGRFSVRGIGAPLELFEVTEPALARQELGVNDAAFCEGRAALALLHRSRRAGARIDALDPPLKSLLQICSVIGPDLSADVLARMTGTPRGVILQQLHSICDRGLLRPARLSQGEGQGQGFEFPAPLLREIASGMQMQSRRRQVRALHAQLLAQPHQEARPRCLGLAPESRPGQLVHAA